ncbi:TPA: hypothetical protein ACSQRE_000121 [Clostridium perfringens]|uniref:hypothetical protein n=1 Tax=Clostridium perfringens TaxID=1502 RepID=UPI000B365283|nr:hypothetical protein [Clostridium perfringens]OUN51910.1 hypothetical protein B5G18_11705 [Clostridium perfringens]OUP46209.1 hypothetical protein B5F20_09575 [Clostridium perfringens]
MKKEMIERLSKIMTLVETEVGETNELRIDDFVMSYEVFNRIDNIYRDGNFAIKYDEDEEKFFLYTSYSGRLITDRWINRCHQMKILVDDINEILKGVDVNEKR